MGQGRRGQPAVCVAHGATAGHSCTERPGSSAGFPAWFPSLASIPVITKIHTGDKDAAALLPRLAPEMSHSRGAWGRASRLPQASTCPGHLQPPALLVCRVKWHQQDKSSLQPKARSFQPTFAWDRIPTNPTQPSSSRPHFQALTYFVL